MDSFDPNSSIDPTQKDGIKTEVKDKAKEALEGLPGDISENIGQPNFAAAPLGSSDAFNSGSDASPDAYGVFESPGNTFVAGLQTFTADDNGNFNIPNQTGELQPVTSPNSFTLVTDPIALTIEDVDPGSEFSIKFILPQVSADALPSDLSQARYLKFNNFDKEFKDYRDEERNKLYNYQLIDDKNSNNIREAGDVVELTLNFTEGTGMGS